MSERARSGHPSVHAEVDIPQGSPLARPYPAARRRLVFGAAYLFALAIFFRAQLASGFDLGFGDRADGLIEISVLEHWRNVFGGLARWDTTAYFYPYGGTLGYNDGYFLYGCVYSVWRLLFDPFHADMLNLATFKTIGFVASYWLVARTLAWGRGAALGVAVLWTISGNLSLQAVHAQLQSVALLPVAMILAVECVRASQARRTRTARGCAIALAALLCAWLMTSYYMAWFTLFSGCLFLLCWGLATENWRPAAVARLVRAHVGTFLYGAVTFAILLLPFLHVYLPKMRETGGETVDAMRTWLVTPLVGMINVGPDNYLWGWLFRALRAAISDGSRDGAAIASSRLGGEHQSGFPLVLFALIVTAAWLILVRNRAGSGRAVTPHLKTFALAMMIAWLLTLDLGAASPWALVFDLVPGARGMRVVARYQLWLTLPLLLLVAAVWRERGAVLARSYPWRAAGIAVVLVVENLSAASPAQLRGSEQRAALWSIPAPPSACDSFYVVASRRNEPLYGNAALQALYPHNVDAMLLAERWNVPTINGVSTFNPPDWAFAGPMAPDYDTRVRAYARRHGLMRLCRLDVRKAQPWTGAVGRGATPGN